MTNTKRDCLRFFDVFILSIFILLSGCSATETKPDSCKDEPRCELHNTFLDPPVRLEVGVSREISICACRPWNNTGIKVDSKYPPAKPGALICAQSGLTGSLTRPLLLWPPFGGRSAP